MAPSIKAMMDAMYLRKTVIERLDPELWDTPVTEGSTAKHLSTYMARKIQSYAFMPPEDTFWYFREDFEQWTDAQFKLVDSDIAREMKRTLRTKGIYTGNKHLTCVASFRSLMDLPSYPGWPMDAPRELRTDNEKLYDREKGTRYSVPVPETPATAPAAAPRGGMPDNNNGNGGDNGAPGGNGAPSGNGAPGGSGNPGGSGHPDHFGGNGNGHGSGHGNGNGYGNGYGFGHGNGFGNGHGNDPGNGPANGHGNGYGNNFGNGYGGFGMPQPDPYATLPPIPVENMPLDPNKAGNLSKHYQDDDMYTGEPYDIFDDKVHIFLGICKNLSIQPDQFRAAFPAMLKGRARTYMIQHINRQDTFATAYQKMKARFNTAANHQDYHTDWNTITFTGLQHKHPDKDKAEILQILINKLTLYSRALGYNKYSDQHLRDNVLRAIKGIPEFTFALIAPHSSTEALYSSLRAALQAAKYQGTSSAFNVVAEDDDHDDQYYTDRRYNGRRRGNPNNPRDRGPPDRRDHGNNRGNTRNYSDNGYRRNNRGGYNDRRNNNNASRNNKRCYVCGKTGCWSTRYPPEERWRLRNTYFTMQEQLGKEPTNSEYAAFIADYEGLDINNEDESDSANDDKEQKAYAVHIMD
ncbi:hypothetical protein FJTKL_07413 [Diaporthe vaccinii]|uniref:Uncharacterized protein n=1 Tax=Diaporthe vaccinii TaxID=105482 RepID=A0ABR4EU00_9PEZI